jgi:hypothetical protein
MLRPVVHAERQAAGNVRCDGTIDVLHCHRYRLQRSVAASHLGHAPANTFHVPMFDGSERPDPPIINGEGLRPASAPHPVGSIDDDLAVMLRPRCRWTTCGGEPCPLRRTRSGWAVPRFRCCGRRTPACPGWQASIRRLSPTRGGHGLGVSLKVYTSSDMEQKRAALKKLEAAVLREPQSEPSALAKSA